MTAAVGAATTAAGPSPLWYATRGAGVTTLVLLTVTVVLGVGTALHWEGPATPRFVTAGLHRNLSLLAVALLAVHVVTTLLDPFAAIGVAGATVPFSGAYRRLWLGLGVLAAEVLLAVALTSAARRRLGPRTWRLVHWAAYASWPLAVVHGLGTGSDAQAPWLLGLTAACVTAVVAAVARRLAAGTRVTLRARLLAGALAAVSVTEILLWAVRGPLQPGWAADAGTPASVSAPAGAPVHAGPGGFTDALVGSSAGQAPGQVQVAFRDVADPGLTLTVRPAGPGESLPVVTVARNGRTVCSGPASAGETLYMVCGATRLSVRLFGGPGHLTGRLSASGPLG